MSLLEVQHAFSAHLRDPSRAPAPSDVEPRRMQVYCELVFANVASLLATSFPVLRGLLANETWNALIRAFLAGHAAQTPLFSRLAPELITWLASDREALEGEPPFLLELARWEWLETELLLSEAEPDWAAIDREGDLMRGVPVVSPLARWVRTAWPVHRLGGGSPAPAEPPARETALALCRGEDERVRFMELTPLTWTLLERLAEKTPVRSGRAQLERLARELGREDGDRFIAQGRRVLESLHERGMLLGTRRIAARGDETRQGESA